MNIEYAHRLCLWYTSDGLILYCLTPTDAGDYWEFRKSDSAVLVHATNKGEQGFVPGRFELLPFGPTILRVAKSAIIRVSDTTEDAIHDHIRQLLSGLVIAQGIPRLNGHG